MIRPVLVTLALWAFLACPPAKADPADDAFLDAVDAVEITYSTPDVAIGLGRAVCDDLYVGYSAADAVTTIVELTDIATYQAGALVGAAIAAYCPGFNAIGWVA